MNDITEGNHHHDCRDCCHHDVDVVVQCDSETESPNERDERNAAGDQHRPDLTKEQIYDEHQNDAADGKNLEQADFSLPGGFDAFDGDTGEVDMVFGEAFGFAVIDDRADETWQGLYGSVFWNELYQNRGVLGRRRYEQISQQRILKNFFT